MKYLADPYNQLPAITFWLLGSLAATTSGDVAGDAAAGAAGPRPALAAALADERADARRRGGARARRRHAGACALVVIAAATLMTAAVVVDRGDHRLDRAARFRMSRGCSSARTSARLLPVAMLLGAGFLLGGRHAGADGGADRDPARRAHRVRRHAALPLAARDRAAELAVRPCDSRDLAFGYPGKHGRPRTCRFALAAGEVMCLLGPNGGGKTTLFRTMLGLLPPQGGRVRSTARRSRAGRARRGRAQRSATCRRRSSATSRSRCATWC